MNNTTDIFVTGSAGFIGSRLVAELAKQGNRVRALVRSTSHRDPTSQGVEYVVGDLCDRDSLRSGMEGCSQVFHLAAYAKNWSPDPETPRKINVEGSRNVFEVARELNINRVVHTSSIVTFGPTLPGVVGNEDMPRVTQKYFTAYEETKSEVEAYALQLAKDGMPIVIVNPTRVYGPGKLTEGNSVTKMLLQHSRGQFPILLNRGVNVGNYVHVDDLVQGYILAMARGRIGERYILGGDNASLLQLIQWVNQFSGHTHFQINFTPSMAIAYAKLQLRLAEWTGIYPQITPGWTQTFLQNWVFDSGKAKCELGYTSRPLVDGIRQTVEWFKTIP